MEKKKEEYESLQIKVFSRWATNALLPLQITINDITTDFTDGVNLVKLAEVLTRKPAFRKWDPKPRIVIQKTQNCDLAIEMFIKDGVSFVNIGGKDIVDANKKLTLGLIWTLILKYTISEVQDFDDHQPQPPTQVNNEDNTSAQEQPQENKPQKPAEKKVTATQALMNWAVNNTHLYENIENFQPLPLAMCALLNNYTPDKIKFEKLNPNDNETNAKLAMETCEILGVPLLLDWEDLVNGTDDKTLFTQLSLIKKELKTVPRQIIEVDGVLERAVPIVEPTDLEKVLINWAQLKGLKGDFTNLQEIKDSFVPFAKILLTNNENQENVEFGENDDFIAAFRDRGVKIDDSINLENLGNDENIQKVMISLVVKYSLRPENEEYDEQAEIAKISITKPPILAMADLIQSYIPTPMDGTNGSELNDFAEITEKFCRENELPLLLDRNQELNLDLEDRAVFVELAALKEALERIKKRLEEEEAEKERLRKEEEERLKKEEEERQRKEEEERLKKEEEERQRKEEEERLKKEEEERLKKEEEERLKKEEEERLRKEEEERLKKEEEERLKKEEEERQRKEEEERLKKEEEERLKKEEEERLKKEEEERLKKEEEERLKKEEEERLKKEEEERQRKEEEERLKKEEEERLKKEEEERLKKEEEEIAEVQERKIKIEDEFDLEDAVNVLIQDKKPEEKVKTTGNNVVKFLEDNMLTILKVVSVLALLIFLFILFFPREDTIVIDLPLPYVFFIPFKNALETFARLDCHNEVLVIRGPKGIGKSRGLVTFADTIRADGRLVINFDCERLHHLSTDADIVEMIRNGVLTAFRNLDGNSYRTTNVKEALAAVDAIAEIYKVNMSAINRPIHDQFLKQVASDLSVIIGQMKNGANFGLNLFLECIQILSPTLRPIIIINSPDKIAKMNTTFSNEVFNTFVNSFEKIAHDTTNYGVIVEISDEEWLLSKYEKIDSTEKSQIYRWITVEEFDVDSAKQLLTGRGMFKPNQVQKLHTEFNGYGPIFAQVHEFMREELSFDDAISKAQSQIFYNLKKILKNNEHVNLHPLLERLIREEEVLVDDSNLESVLVLLREGVVFFQDRSHVRLSNLAIVKTVKVLMRNSEL